MGKVVDWESLSKPFGSNPLPGAPKHKYASGKERMLKAFADEAEREKQMQVMAKAEPGMQAVFKYRMLNRVPLKVMRPLQYRTSELTKGDRPQFIDTVKVVQPGTVITPVSIDPTMNEYIFKSQAGEEIAISFADQQQIYLSTDIYDFVFNHLKGE